ncbi:hypothetical protein SteCoe_14923 [Stentor coeruleus]|uniref:Uncharacterized protein n=1 Tax=Stentor coeruleus TaxID=5963 RepID=A0A1R2C4U9_9CILI|nr:hypothetical protein SteCoe_14923 [Stentor coeruleus]
MDFIIAHPIISKFLVQFPIEIWKSVIITTILNGIPYTPVPTQKNIGKLSSPLPHLRQQLNFMREEIERLNKSFDAPRISSKSTTKKKNLNARTQKKIEGKNEENSKFQNVSTHKKSVSPIRNKRVKRYSSPMRNKSVSSWKMIKPPMKPRIIPKYLQNVDSKIRYEVQKDIENYKLLCESMREDSPDKNSPSLIDLSEKDTHKDDQRSLEYTETHNINIAYKPSLKVQPINEILLYRDIDTPRYPADTIKDPIERISYQISSTDSDSQSKSQSLSSLKISSQLKDTPEILSSEDPYTISDPSLREEDLQQSNILEIADNFLSGSIMAEFCSIENSAEVSKSVKGQEVPPLDLLGSDESSMSFRQRWEDAIKNIRKKWDNDNKSRDSGKNTTSREFYSGRSSGMIMVQTPSPIPYDNKLGPMFQDASYQNANNTFY